MQGRDCDNFENGIALSDMIAVLPAGWRYEHCSDPSASHTLAMMLGDEPW